MEPVSPLFRARAFQYAVTKLAGSGFAQDYSILMGGCSCKVDPNQMVSKAWETLRSVWGL